MTKYELPDGTAEALLDICRVIDREPGWVLERIIACTHDSVFKETEPSAIQEALEAFWLEGQYSRKGAKPWHTRIASSN